DMNRYDGSVEQINISDSTADLSIVNQQSLANVSISDVQHQTIRLDYDSQVVAGENDTLGLTLQQSEVEVNVDAGIEAVQVKVEGSAEQGVALTLNAENVTNVTVSDANGGIAAFTPVVDADTTTFSLNVNQDRAAGA